jgi:alkylglycerol monooxygenase
MDTSYWVMPLMIVGLLLLIGFEWYWVQRTQRNYTFTYAHTMTSVTIGLFERMTNFMVTGIFYGVFLWIHSHLALFEMPHHWSTMVLLILVTDFVWYWYHRLGHEVNIFWGAHVVHHQSEEFNFATAGRITLLQSFVRHLFWCLLPLIGFPPDFVFISVVILGIYSVFTHTQIIGKLGWLEYVFVTPTHHGVHHASNEKYLNKNYGNIFIIWDKLFGTFVEETEKPVYGLTHDLKNHGFLWNHFHYYLELLATAKTKDRFLDKCRVFFANPETMNPNIRKNLEQQLSRSSSAVKPKQSLRHYTTIQLGLSVIIYILFMIYFNQLTSLQIFLLVLLVLLTLILVGNLLENLTTFPDLEALRLVVFVLFLGTWFKPALIFSVALISSLIYLIFRKKIATIIIPFFYIQALGTKTNQ